MQVAREMAAATARPWSAARWTTSLIASTGVIGVPLDIDKVRAGVIDAARARSACRAVTPRRAPS